jgi:hypothetical protein
VARFKHRDHGGAVQYARAMFIPKGGSLPRSKLRDIVRKAWGLELPNMLVNCDAGAAHPKQLATKMLLELPHFEQWIEDIKTHNSEGRTAPGESKDSSVANTLLFQKLITIFSAVVDAAAMSNNCAYVGRFSLFGLTDCFAVHIAP